MNPFRGIFKALALIGLLLTYFAGTFSVHFVTRDPHKRRKRFIKIVRWTSALGLRVLGVRVTLINRPQRDRRFLLVGNHLGFLDIMITARAVPALFVTSNEMKEMPVLGLLTEMAGCLYVERRSRDNIPNEIKNITSALNDGFNVVLYPEGTSSDGQAVLPFKKSMLTAAGQSEANILPMCLNYVRVNGAPMSDKYRDHIFWYGDLGFLECAWRLVQLKSVEAELIFLEEVVVSPETDRRDIAANAQAQIEKCYRPIRRLGSVGDVQPEFHAFHRR